MILQLQLAEWLTEVSPEEFAQEARLAVAAQLYGLGRVSSGRAAELAGVERLVFLPSLDRFDVPAINWTPEEVALDADFVARNF
jgi:predicted HTH domain antitoxin